MTSPPDREGPAREQLSALRSMLVLAMLLTQQDSQDSILHYVANAVESLGSCTTQGIFLDGLWQEVRLPGRKATSLPTVLRGRGGRVTLAGVPWSWAYSLSSRHGPAGYLVVGAPAPPAESERFLLQVLAQQAGVALANARLHGREREQAEQLRLANLALVRSMEIHDRLTKVALEGEGQAGIARAVYDLTDRPAAIEDRFAGNLLAWAGPDRPDPYPKAGPAQQDRLLDRAMSAAGPVQEGERLLSVAALGGSPVAVLVLHDPAGTAASSERVAVEHATTVLTMEIARLQHLAQGEARTRINFVLNLVGDAGAQKATLLNRAQALGCDLVRPHRVVVVEAAGAHREDNIDMFFHAESAGRPGRPEWGRCWRHGCTT